MDEYVIFLTTLHFSSVNALNTDNVARPGESTLALLLRKCECCALAVRKLIETVPKMQSKFTAMEAEIASLKNELALKNAQSAVLPPVENELVESSAFGANAAKRCFFLYPRGIGGFGGFNIINKSWAEKLQMQGTCIIPAAYLDMRQWSATHEAIPIADGELQDAMKYLQDSLDERMSPTK